MKWILTLTVALLLAACGDNPTTSTQDDFANPPDTTDSVVPSKGKIAIGVANITLGKVVAAADDSLVTDTNGISIVLPTVRHSKAFFFIYKNVGTASITNLKVTTSDSAFIMSPAFVPVLETDVNTSFAQIAELDVIHGTAIGTQTLIEKLLPYGETVFSIYFDGESAGEPFHAEFKISVSAIYVEIDPIETSSGVLVENAEYKGTSCSVIHQSKPIEIGDTASFFDMTYVDEDGETIYVLSKSVESDCVIKNRMPKFLI